MPLLKHLPVRLRGGGPTLHNALVLRRMSLNITAHMNPFNDDSLDADSQGWSPGSSLLDGDVCRDRNPFEDEEDENEANKGKRGGVNGKAGGSAGKGSGGKGGGFKFGSPLRTLGKLGKSLRSSGRGKETPSPSESPGEKKKRGRRSSEGSLLRFAGRYRDSFSRKDCISNGDPGSEEDTQSRRLSLMKMVLGKHKRESGSERVSQGPEEPEPEPEPEEVVKPREPLSVLEILQLVKKRDLLLADAHILELEQEVMASCDQSDESGRDNGRRRAKDVELLYEELQKELWSVVRESLRSPTAGPNLGLVVQVLQQEEQVDQDFLSSQTEVWVSSAGPRPRRLRQRWVEAVGEMADSSLPVKTQFSVGFLDRFLDQIRTRVVEDLSAAKRNVVSIYPPEYQPFQVYAQSYHMAVTKRLRSITENQLQITDIYSVLDWVYNIYNRDVLGPFSCSDLDPLLPSDTLERLELDCLNSMRAIVTSELVQVLEDEEKRWMETLHIEEYTLPLTNTVIKRLQVDLDRSVSVNQSLGSRVAQCSLNGLADFFYSFQRKVELFHEGLQSGMYGDNEDGYVSKTIAQVNCCPAFRDFAQRCAQSDPVHSEDSLRRASRALDSVVQCGVRVLSERLYYCIKPLYERLVKKKWLSNTEPFEEIQSIIKEHFKKYKRMDNPPYQALVSEVHRRVLTEYLRSVMRGRLICTSAKMRRRTSQRLRDEGTAMSELFTQLDSPCRWLEGALSHLSEIIDLEDLPSIQMEVAVLARGYPDVRRKHVSAILNLRGLTRQTERIEILSVLKDLESNQDSWDLPRDRALFSEVPVTSELHCVNVGLSRLALTATSCFTNIRPKRKRTKRTRRDTNEEEEVL
ncbi:exocyst complex component 3-like protein 2 [Eucyclogobius newberryi]|uniref:exocyst complex component 3-like protein 2 n=1 Tax=Eucyclogobius newberryi TaxID=166745 RepID=UPI003B5CA3AE